MGFPRISVMGEVVPAKEFRLADFLWCMRHYLVTLYIFVLFFFLFKSVVASVSIAACGISKNVDNSLCKLKVPHEKHHRHFRMVRSCRWNSVILLLGDLEKV